jgi:hypothetical protein
MFQITFPELLSIETAAGQSITFTSLRNACAPKLRLFIDTSKGKNIYTKVLERGIGEKDECASADYETITIQNQDKKRREKKEIIDNVNIWFHLGKWYYFLHVQTSNTSLDASVKNIVQAGKG